jgi:hypothetical protein
MRLARPEESSGKNNFERSVYISELGLQGSWWIETDHSAGIDNVWALQRIVTLFLFYTMQL